MYRKRYIYDLNKLLRTPQYSSNPSILETFIKPQKNMPDGLPIKTTIIKEGDKITRKFTAYDALTGKTFNVKTEVIYVNELTKQVLIDISKGIGIDTINQKETIEALK